MKKEISDGMKEDLQKVVCDNYICDSRGDVARCYLDYGDGRYRECHKYKFFELFKKRHQ